MDAPAILSLIGLTSDDLPIEVTDMFANLTSDV
jgi:hypothetical protein